MKSTQTKPTDIGSNRTGIMTSLEEAKRSQEGATEAIKKSSTDVEHLNQMRLGFSKNAPPVGTMAPLKAVDHVPPVFLDHLGSRIGFERAGVRLYELLMVKLQAAHPHSGGPTLEDLEQLRDEELQHLAVTMRAVESLGADPTVITPAADISTVNSSGILKNLADPRVTLTEALDSILIAELNDNETWSMLADLAQKLGRSDLAKEFHRVLEQEQEHLEKVRVWLNSSISGQAGLEPPPLGQHPGAPSLA
jgi:rubrerythrin